MSHIQKKADVKTGREAVGELAQWQGLSVLKPLCRHPNGLCCVGRPAEGSTYLQKTGLGVFGGSLSPAPPKDQEVPAPHHLSVPLTAAPPFSPFLWLWVYTSLSVLIFLGSPLNVF